MMESRFRKLITGKNVIYITVKNRDYIRTRQIEKILGECAGSFEIYTSEKRNPLSRALDLRKRIHNIRFENCDVVIVGFLPQLIWGNVQRCALAQNKSYSGKNRIYTQISSIDKRDQRPKMIADMFLSLYDTVVLDRKLVRKNGLISALCKALDKRVLLQAELVLADTKADEDFFADQFSADRQKMEVLYLEAMIGNLNRLEGARYQYSNTNKKAKTILYFGTGLPLQGTDIVARAYQILHNQDENRRIIASAEGGKHYATKAIKLIYIGGTDHMTRSLREFMQGESVEYHKWLLEDELLSKIKEADICLAGHFNASIDKADRTIPGKTFIYEALHKKMILGDTKANHEIFSQDEKHIFVDRGNAEALAKCIRKSLQ